MHVNSDLYNPINGLPSSRQRFVRRQDAPSLVDAVLPDLLFRPRAVRACAQDVSHLLNTGKQHLTCHKPPDAFAARGARQATLVRPELVEFQDAVKRQLDVDLDLLLGPRLVEPNHRRQLIEKCVVRVAWVKTDGHHGLLMTFLVNMNEMELRLGPIAVHRVIGWRVNVPALQVHRRIVEASRRVLCPDAVWVGNGKCWSKVPVVKVALCLLRVVKRDNVVQGQAVVEAEGNWRLLSTRLAQCVVYRGSVSGYSGRRLAAQLWVYY